MYTPVLANKLTELADKFGLHTDVFIAHTIAFTILVIVVVKFGIKPIMQQLEERRARIEEGEAMHARSEKELAEVKSTGEKIIAEAHATGKEQIEHAKQTAAKLRDELTEKASVEARSIIENARQQAEMDTQREKEALRSEFARLVAQATSQVTGKVLSEADHRAINSEIIKQL